MKIYHELIQGSDEWFAVRMGKVTASMAATLLVKPKKPKEGEAKLFGVGAYTEMRRIAEERITGKPRQNFSSKATNYGHENEPLGVEHYESVNFQKTQVVGFCEMNEWIGCSPDRLVGEDGGLEVKCLPVNHIEIIDNGTYDGMSKHITQCQFNLWVTGRKWWDLIFYHPDFPEHLKMITFRYKPDLEFQNLMNERSELFIKEAKKMLKRFNSKKS